MRVNDKRVEKNIVSNNYTWFKPDERKEAKVFGNRTANNQCGFKHKSEWKYKYIPNIGEDKPEEVFCESFPVSSRV